VRRLLDVVNLNADASCLRAATWLAALSGGASSRCCAWLRGYVELERKVVLGIAGATLADMRAYNPEAIQLIDAHPEVFEIILRPFAHDIAFLRTPAGFARNLELGRRVLEQSFARVTPFYLPPEFMLSSSQLAQLARAAVSGVFICADRFAPLVQRCIPKLPYVVTGAMEAKLPCIPLRGQLTRAYLTSLHEFRGACWNRELQAIDGDLLACWRDGESWLFVPDGEARERAWLADERGDAERVFVRELMPACSLVEPSTEVAHGWSYPVHSFAEWFKESRMLGYLQRVQTLEQQLPSFTPLQTALWLKAINSDVLSSVEKDSPLIRINDRPEQSLDHKRDWLILRSERGFEGEEFLSLLESADDITAFVQSSDAPHMHKLRARLACLI
jgi:hypothetical protein